MTQSEYHQPVLVKEVLEYLNVKPNQRYIDATIGGAGHTREILKLGGIVLGLDQDPDALTHVTSTLDHKNLTLVQSNFLQLHSIASQQNFKPVAGILFDLGVSSHQFDDKSRGFSFFEDNELDMRMDQTAAVKARDLIAALGVGELAKLFDLYGDERLAKPIAREIVERRKREPITTTRQLAQITTAMYAKYHIKPKLNPATKVFQALRIAVNDEINTLKQVLPQALDLLESAGRLVVISFHEGEDRVVKNFFKDQLALNSATLLTHKPITPTLTEVANNPRSRSAKLRALEKNK